MHCNIPQRPLPRRLCSMMSSPWAVVLVAGYFALTVSGFIKEFPESEIEAAFKKHKIVPDLIQEAPKKFLYVKYRSPKSVYYVRLGTDLHPLQVDEEPEDIEWEPEPGAYYTLLHLGPNANGYQKEWNEANFLHYAKVNILGNDWKHSGHLLAEYVGSRPFPEFGAPYYVYLLYKQPKLIDFKETHDVDDYVKYDWDLKAFLNKHGIKDLVAGNFYVSRSDWTKLKTLLTVEPGDWDTITPKML
ncbi:hypothetical protein M8J76_012078 [Diaphorina citri]|nr:hypothetical protein M8J76_012078 [Diaphorina citri]